MVFNATFNNISVILWQSSPKYMSIIIIIDGINFFLNCNYNYMYLILKIKIKRFLLNMIPNFLNTLKEIFKMNKGR
jgi:hypothetical protein